LKSSSRCRKAARLTNTVSGGRTLEFLADNYFKVQYSVLNVTLKEDFNPCVDLEGKSAKLVYVESKGLAVVVAIEIHKN